MNVEKAYDPGDELRPCDREQQCTAYVRSLEAKCEQLKAEHLAETEDLKKRLVVTTNAMIKLGRENDKLKARRELSNSNPVKGLRLTLYPVLG